VIIDYQYFHVTIPVCIDSKQYFIPRTEAPPACCRAKQTKSLANRHFCATRQFFCDRIDDTFGLFTRPDRTTMMRQPDIV